MTPIIRKIIFLAFLVPAICSAQTIDSAWLLKHYVKKERLIPMRDGAKLYTAIYMADDSLPKTHPIMLLRTPYSCAPYGKKWITIWYSYLRNYCKEGYTIVFQDVRGRYMSQGDFVNIRPFNKDKTGNKDIDEASDSYDTIDWLVKHVTGNNGKVGCLGTSYGGFYAAMAALSGHPALKAVSPQAPVTDWFAGDDIHHNGAFMLMDMYNFFVAGGFGAPRQHLTTESAKALPQPNPDSYAYFLQMGALPAFSKIADEHKVAFWNELMSHPNYDKWWQARNDRQFMGKIPAGTACLVVGGLFDAEDCFGAINLYEAIGQKTGRTNKFVFGPWRHGQWGGNKDLGDHLGHIQFGSNTSTWYTSHIEMPFFNYYLKGIGSPESVAGATIFFTGENQWHKFDRWHLKNAKHSSLYLHADGKLSFQASKEHNSSKHYISDPSKPVPYTDGIYTDRIAEYMDDDQRFAEKRPDVLTFKTEPLTQNITLVGPLTADLMVSISTTDADFVVKLIDVFPDNFKYSNSDQYNMGGYEMLVRGDILRGKYRNSLEKPVPFVPNKISEVKYKLNDVAHTFKKGHRIMVQVQSSWFPVADRNPQQFIDIYHAKNSDFIKSRIKVYTSADNASKIILPIVKN